MEAAERIFDGSFDHIVDEDGDVEMASLEKPQQKPRMMVRALRSVALKFTREPVARAQTPNDDDDDDDGGEVGDDDEGDDGT